MLHDIDTRQGTDSSGSYSHGNTLPITNVPFGMNSYVLETTTKNGSWFFNPRHRTVEGLRVSHQPSPHVGDFGHFSLLPIAGQAYWNPHTYLSSYRPEEAVFAPHYLRVRLLRYRAELELTPCERGANLRLTYDGPEAAGLLLSCYQDPASFTVDYAHNRLCGFTGGKAFSEDPDFGAWFVLEFDTPLDPQASGFLGEEDFLHAPSFEGRGRRCVLYFKDMTAGQVQVRLSVSFISAQQALRNLERENACSFEEMKAQAEARWETYLDRIRVETRDEELRRTFYTCLYRMFCFPQKFYELDENGRPIHYNTHARRVEPGVLYTNNGFWDTYKTVYPLYSLIAPDEYEEMLEGFLQSARETGFLPKWLSPDERGYMPGTLIDAIFADACTKGIGSSCMEEALTYMLRGANVQSEDGRYGRRGTLDYRKYGYVPCDRHDESVNHTLDYVYSDYCISVVAEALGKAELAEEYRGYSRNYRHLFDAQAGLMRAKTAAGGFREPFDPHAWGGDYCEGSAYQNSFAVYHDIGGLIRLYGDKDRFLHTLIDLFNQEPVFRTGRYQAEIHEMSEMAAVDFGQCAISNQPSFHLPYLFTYAGRPDLTQLAVKQLLTLFNSGFEGYPGDEDNGSMAGFFVFSAMGFYPVCPGSGEYVLGIPRFDRVEIYPPRGKAFTLTARGCVPQNNFVTARCRDGVPYEKCTIRHEDILRGGCLSATLGLIPPMEAAADDAPVLARTLTDGDIRRNLRWHKPYTPPPSSASAEWETGTATLSGKRRRKFISRASMTSAPRHWKKRKRRGCIPTGVWRNCWRTSRWS